ncbi:MAG: hypothetical protein DI539_11715 [Flavobacterium psychrophilum]|nr:MAG: hypothetical protein DI539_11715 [Flavobacterium psychrophilum]
MVSYDNNGNIKRIERNGESDTSSSTIEIDDLTYTYDTSIKDRLLKVVDASAHPKGFKDSPANTADDYTYDSNGNMITDQNKGITSILYNHLNLPSAIIFNNSTTQKINYLYNADGVKVQKVVTNGSVITTTDYLSGFQYTNSVLDFYPTPEGYVKVTWGAQAPTLGIHSYVFNYKDHLGNNRVSYTVDPADGVLKIMEENHYYPFGLKHNGYSGAQQMMREINIAPFVVVTPVINPVDATYKIKYNGKELQDELGLGWYDYQARNYDPTIGRWFNIDPLAEVSRRYSPYTYALNNPVYFIDPDGMLATPPIDFYNKKGEKIGTDGNVNDNRKVVVTDNKEAKAIKNTNKSNGTTQLSSVASGVVLPSDTALQESLNVLDRTIANGGLREESSLVMKDGTTVQGQTGPMPTIVNGVQTAPTSLPNLPAGATVSDVEVSIHSHLTTVQQDGGKVYPQSASTPSTGPNSDQQTFQQFNTNIIVGPLGPVNNVTANPNGTLNIPNRPNGVAIYDSNSNLQIELPRRAVENILKN